MHFRQQAATKAAAIITFAAGSLANCNGGAGH
jgi:hypothetical protein